jgi:hypothetical protein
VGGGSDSDDKYSLIRVAPDTGRAASINNCVPHLLLSEMSLSFRHENHSHRDKHRNIGLRMLRIMASSWS